MAETKSPKHTTLVIPDLHLPFEHQDALPFLTAVEAKYKPTKYVCLGDEVDAHALSDYDTDPDGMSAGAELEAALEKIQPYYKAFPNMDVCESNHTDRVYKKAFKAGIPRAYLKQYKEWMRAPDGWSWNEYVEIDGVLYEHGEGFSGQGGAIKAALANMQPTVIGHLHSFAGIQWAANPKFLIFGFNAGCIIDKDKYAFAYGKKMKNKPILGAGIVQKGIPLFVPMLLDGHGRWVGKL